MFNCYFVISSYSAHSHTQQHLSIIIIAINCNVIVIDINILLFVLLYFIVVTIYIYIININSYLVCVSICHVILSWWYIHSEYDSEWIIVIEIKVWNSRGKYIWRERSETRNRGKRGKYKRKNVGKRRGRFEKMSFPRERGCIGEGATQSL